MQNNQKLLSDAKLRVHKYDSLSVKIAYLTMYFSISLTVSNKFYKLIKVPWSS